VRRLEMPLRALIKATRGIRLVGQKQTRMASPGVDELIVTERLVP
jgi:hypothetical protein